MGKVFLENYNVPSNEKHQLQYSTDDDNTAMSNRLRDNFYKENENILSTFRVDWTK